MTLIEAAILILKENRVPMKPQNIWDEIYKKKFFKSEGKTPWATLTTQMIFYCKGIKASVEYKQKLFYRSSPGKYGLLEWLSEDEMKLLEQDELIEELIEKEYAPDASLFDTNLFLEKEWHHWLYKNLETNGLTALGFGKLQLFDSSIQNADNLGKYNTHIVGEIDLMLRKDNEDLVVVELKRKGVDETVGQICRYVGWVEENLLKKNKKVFGVIIAQTIDDKLRYAIKPIKDHIFYQQLKMSVEFGESSKTQNT